MNIDELRSRVDTIVVVMMENRSFDHILGHMSLPDYGGRTDIEGIHSLQDPNLANGSVNGTLVSPFIATDGPLPNDVPHEREFVTTQLARSAVAGGFTMTGFVKAYEDFTGTTGVLRPPPMGLLTPRDLPMTAFLAREYGLCDHWFAPLPTSTQPNRLMAMSGYTLNEHTHSGPLPNQHTVLDWLEQRQIRWRVYSAGISFFALMPQLWPFLLTDHFQKLPALSHDVGADAPWPQVIFIEPDYADSPVHLSGHASDDHPPIAVAFGQAFLRQVYEALTSNPDRWARTVMILTYDEHGGFFDHVAPLAIPFAPPPNANFTAPFDSTGIRVPAIVVSPMIERGIVKHELLDHTSILQFIAERFGTGGEIYSADVEARRQAGIASVSALLNAQLGARDIAEAPSDPVTAVASLTTTREPTTDNQKAFVAAIEGFARAHGPAALAKYPEIAHWMS